MVINIFMINRVALCLICIKRFQMVKMRNDTHTNSQSYSNSKSYSLGTASSI